MVGKQFYAVEKRQQVTGRDLKNARAGVDQNNQPDVQFTLIPTGADKFKPGRRVGSVGRRLAIILDGNVASAPVIQSQIGGEGVITGHSRRQEADELSKVLRGRRAARQAHVPAGADGRRLARQGTRSGRA